MSDGVVITLDQIYQKLEAVDDTVKAMATRVDTIADHETRIRSIERRMWVVAGLAAAGAGGITQAFNSLMGG